MQRGREAARVVVLDPENRILLINAVDPRDASKGDWWEIPGGGMDPGEASADCAQRELVEEAGIVDAEMGPVIWTQHVSYMFAGMHFEQDEYVHLARWAGGEQRPPQLEFFEALAFRGMRWWTSDELVASDVRTLPPRLREFLPAIVDGDIPDEPLDISGEW